MRWHLDKITLVALVALILYLDYRIIRPFLNPLAWAAVVTVFTHRLYQWLSKRINRPNFAAFTSVCLVAIVIVAPAIAIGTACVREGVLFFRDMSEGDILPKLRDSLDWAIQSLPVSRADLENWLKELAGTAGSQLAAWSAGAARGVLEALFHLGIMFLAMFYFYRDGPLIVRFFKDASPFTEKTTDKVVQNIDNLINATLAGNFAVALSQGFLLGLIFWLLGLTAPVFWGVVTGVIAFLPLLGAAPIWLVAAVVLFIQGEIWRGIAMLVLGTFVISLADNVVRPLFVTKRSGLTVLVVLISLLGGLLAFGFLGVVLGPLLAALTLGLLAGYQTEMKGMKVS
jgi:predicted PurR-regulated permease PerM